MIVSVCIATYRRVDRLDKLLSDLAHQDLLPDRVVVVDNDASGSARATVDRHRNDAPFEIQYDIQSERNIAKTRNRTVALARGDWFAFVDDDERAPPEWLQHLLDVAQRYDADGVLSPVLPQLPAEAPDWIKRGRFFDFPHQPEGAAVPLNCMRFGNVLLRADRLRAESGPFDESYGLATGEDGDLLVRMASKGAKIIWTELAPVYELIETPRLSLRWLLLRALSGGQEVGRHTVTGRYGPIDSGGRLVFLARTSAQMLLAALLAMISWPFGRHHTATWLVKTWANFGKLSGSWGSRYHLYGEQ